MNTGATETPEEGEDFQLEHVLGARANGGLCALKDEIVYSAATHIVIHNTTTRSQRFIESGEITAMTINSSRNLIGVAEKGTGIVQFYDDRLRPKRKLIHDSISDIRHISMSKDSTKCIVLGGPPNFFLTMWDLERSTAYASLKLSSFTNKEIVSAEVCPQNNNLVSIIGRKIIRLFHVSNKIGDGKFMPVKLNLKPQDYTAQIWLSSSELIVGSESGCLAVINEDKETKQFLNIENSVSSLAACPRGFVVGCCSGSIGLFQRQSDSYSLIRRIPLSSNYAITALAVMKTQGGGTRCDAFGLAQNNSIIKVSLTPSDGDCIKMEFVPSLNQFRPIDSLIPDSGSIFVACCAWKPLVAIGGYDGVIRLFNYHTHQVVLTHRSNDKICNVTFHPSGQYLLVTSTPGFNSTTSTVRIYSVLSETLDVAWKVEDLQQPALARFSQGGDRFAIASGTIVQVHDFYQSFQNESTLRGHSKAIIEISFRGYRDELITIGADGVVCLWDIRGRAITRAIDVTSSIYFSSCVSQDHTHIYAVSSDCMLKRVNVESGKLEAELKCDPNAKLMTALPHGKIAYSDGDQVFAVDESLAMRHCFHQSNVTSIHLGVSSGRLVSASGDSFVAIYSRGDKVSTPSQFCPLDCISIVNRTKFEAKLATIKALEDSIQDLQSKHKRALESSISNDTGVQAKVNDELQLKNGRLQYEINELDDNIQSMEKEHKSEMQRLESQHQVNMQSTHEDCEKRLAAEKKSTENFLASWNDKKQRFEARLIEVANQHTTTIEKETRTLHKLMLGENEKNEELIHKINSMRIDHEKNEKNMEDDADREIAELSTTHQREMKTLRQSNTMLGNERDILQQRHTTMLADLKELEEQVNSQEDKMQLGEETMQLVEAATEADRVAIIEEEKEILKQEKDICFYSQSNLEEHRNGDLVEARNSLTAELAAEEVRVKEKERENEKKKIKLKDVANIGRMQSIELNVLRLKVKHLQETATSMKRKEEEKKQLLVDLEKGIAESMGHINDHKSLKASVCSLSDQFLHGINKRKPHNSVTNREKLLAFDKKVNAARDKITRKKKTHSKEMLRLRREHGMLEKELQKDSRRVQAALAGGPLSESKLINKQEVL